MIHGMTIIYPVPEIFPDSRARFIQIINTCHALAEKGIEVILTTGIKCGYPEEKVLAFYGLPKHPNLKIVRLPVLRREQARYFRFSWHGVFNFSLLLYLFLRKLFAGTQTILFVRHIKLANFVLKLKKILNIPVVFEVHEIFHHTAHDNRKKEIIRNLEYSIYNKADVLVCISHSLKNYLSRTGIQKQFIRVIEDAFKKEWLAANTPVAGSYICYTGNLYLWKGVDSLISAMKYLEDEKLLIVGGGNRLGELKDFARKEGVAQMVEFAGAVQHSLIPGYLSKAKIAVLPNIAQGPSLFSSPLKLFEYMACGVPVVASDIPVFREILIDKKNAVLFEPGNARNLASSIQILLKNPELAVSLANTAKKDAQNYTYEKRAEKILQAIKAINSRS